jgi:hypothetical protein
MRAIRKLTFAVILAITAPVTTYALVDDSIGSQAQQMNTLTKNAGQTNVANRIAADFTTLAGSKANATTLVTALRNGTAVSLTTTTTGGSTTSTTFTPPTGKMGWGNVFISLALAQNVLTQAGITQPTSADLQAALMGGTVTGADGKTITLTGILQQHASGMGWGQIAQSYGVKLGPVVSSIKAANHRLASTSTTANQTTSNAATGTKSNTARTDGYRSKNGIKVASSSASSTGLSTAAGTTAGRAGNSGLTTAAGAASMGSVHGQGHGAGIVTASGNAAGAGATAAIQNANSSANVGAGIVSATGASVTSSGIISAQGGGQGQGNGHGKGKGPG